MRMFILSVVLFFVAGAAQAATLNVVAGELRGASGVDVGGNFYDVQFLDGTCIDLFNGCDEASDFTFQTLASVTSAAQALLDQVFLDVAEGQFDSIPSTTNGCSFSNVACLVFTLSFGPVTLPDPPFPPLAINATQAYSAITSNFTPAFGVDNIRLDGPLLPAFTSSTANGLTFAVWSPVPEPSTALLLGFGLTGLSLAGRGRNRS